MPNSLLSLKPLEPVGAVVSGLAGRLEYSPDVVAELYDAWLQYGVLVFKDVESAAQHLALSRCFGDLEIHPVPELRAEEDPHFFPLGGEGRTNPLVFDELEIRENTIPWHRDTAFTPSICKGAMLRMIETPTSGGETLLADTAAAYDDLPADLKKQLDGLEYCTVFRSGAIDYVGPGAWWKTVRQARDDETPGRVKPKQMAARPDPSKYPSVIMPATFVHPESGRRCIFLSPMNVRSFVGYTREASDDLLEAIVAHMTDGKYVYTHRWSVNDAVLWDNRRFIHAAAGNPYGEKRRGLRTTLAGKLTVGRYAHDEAGRVGVSDIEFGMD